MEKLVRQPVISTRYEPPEEFARTGRIVGSYHFGGREFGLSIPVNLSLHEKLRYDSALLSIRQRLMDQVRHTLDASVENTIREWIVRGPWRSWAA